MISGKTVLRAVMRERRRSMTDRDVYERSLAAQRRVLASDAWSAATSVGLYVGVRRETDTSLLLEEAWKAGKDVYLPHVSPVALGIMNLVLCRSGQDLVKNRFGIPEPASHISPVSQENFGYPDIIVVPGLAFDTEGHRLGSGGGYYDRLFVKKSMRDVIRIGFAYAFQIVESLPAEMWDVPMHALVTEESFVWL